MWLWSAVLSIVGVGFGAYYGWGEHSRWETVGIAVGSVIGGFFVACASAFLFFLVHQSVRHQRDEARARADGLQATIDRQSDRRAQFDVQFDYDGKLVVYITNGGASITDARINLFVPDFEQEAITRIEPNGTVATEGSCERVDDNLMDRYPRSWRWSELHVYLPGAKAGWGMRFDIGRVGEPTRIRFGVNADELGDWLRYHATIHPLEGDEWDYHEGEADEDDDIELD